MRPDIVEDIIVVTRYRLHVIELIHCSSTVDTHGKIDIKKARLSIDCFAYVFR